MGKTMADVLIERGARKARKKVAIETRQQTLVRLLRKRFGDVPPWVVDGIYSTQGVRQLDIWLDRFALAGRLDTRRRGKMSMGEGETGRQATPPDP